MLTAYYDLSVSPPTYEIVSFLMRAEQKARQEGQDKIEVVFLPGPANGFRRDRLWPHGIEARRDLFRNVVVPVCRLLPICAGMRVEENAVGEGWGVRRPIYGLREFVRAYREGIRPLRAGTVERDPRLVTITLREAEHWPDRNSRVGEWITAAHCIHALGCYRVVFIRDTLKANDDGYGRTSFAPNKEAAFDIDIRARLYASAAVNMGISNGPLWLALAMDVPVIMLRPTTDRAGRVFGSEHFKAAGVQPGGQLPGAPAHQRLVWEDDHATNIVAAFKRFTEMKAAA